MVAAERAELDRRVKVYRGGRPPPGWPAVVIVVDDGLATGVTARAALRRCGRAGGRTVLAVPVAAPAAAEAMQKETDEVVTLVTPRRFRSVGEWYVDFGQLTDADVLTILSSGGSRPRDPPLLRIRPRWRGASGDGAPRSARPRSGHPRCRTSQDGQRRS